MMKPVPLDKAMAEILENACGATTPDAEGWTEYYIETHCIMWRVTAKKAGEQWVIKMCTGEAC